MEQESEFSDHFFIRVLREKEMNDFLLMLTATLKVGAIPLNSVDQSEIDRNEFTNGSSSSERTLVENGGSPLRSHDDGKTPVHIESIIDTNSLSTYRIS